VFAIASQWIVYPFFRKTQALLPKAAPVSASTSDGLRVAGSRDLLVPDLALTYPALYHAIIMKSVLMSQQVST
jgi:hypothetical protein